MPTSSQENNPIITRMVLEDRQAINNLLQHKRTEFESVITRGVVAMLNAHDERRKIAKERAKYFDFITRRNKKNKERFSAIAEAAKNTTSSAPMGIGTATNVVFSAASVAGVAAYNNAEERRQESEAEKELHAAQFLHYISSKNYEDIGQRVAEILSYRFQFLLFRLAGGEDGYFKLANFFLESMNTYAIERLREHKGEEVKALIDAAIPPSTDAFTYRDWPQVDFRNLKATIIIGKRKTLALDADADALLARCGPAVRAFLGGYKERVDYATSRITPYKRYTILGALNHAPILGDDGRVISGLKDKRRQYEGLSGTRKYPMILLSCGEKTSDLGVTFGTTMAETLADEHIEALRRLVPHFFSYQANYELVPASSNKQSSEVKTDDAALRYPNERAECPWTSTREARWHQRTQAIYSAGHFVSEEEEEVVTTEHYNQFKAMQAASNTFDAEEARKAVIQMTQEARDIQLVVYATELKSEERHKKQLEAAAIAKYAALAVHDLMTCVITYGPSKDDYFILTDKILEAGHSTLKATRDLPLKESRMYQYALAASQTISTHANVAFSLHLFCQRNFQLLLDILKESTDFNVENKFFHHEKEKQSKQIKKLRDEIKKRTKQALYHYELAKASAITHEAPFSFDSDDYLVSAPDVSNEPVLNPLSTLDAQQEQRLTELTEAMEHLSDEMLNAKTLIEMIDLCEIETKKNHEALRVALTHETCSVIEEIPNNSLDDDDDDDDENEAKNKFTPEAKKKAVLTASEAACEQASSSKRRKDELLANETFWQKRGITTGIKSELVVQRDNALEARKASQTLLRRVKLSPHEELNASSNADVDAFFERIGREANLARLRFDGHRATHIQQKNSPKKPSPQRLQSQQQIQQALTRLEEKTQDLRRSIKKINAHNAEMTYEKIERRADAVRKNSNLHQIAKQARKIRLHCEALEKIMTDDINLIYFLEEKAAFEVAEIEEAKESIDTLKERLAHLYEKHFASTSAVSLAEELDSKAMLDNTSVTGISITSNSTMDRIDDLIKALEENNLLEHSSDNLKETLLSFITNLEETPYLQAIKQDEIQNKMIEILYEMKAKMKENLEYLEDRWEIELVLRINLWLIEAVQKNEVVYRVDEFLELDEGSIAMIQSQITRLPEPTALQDKSNPDITSDTIGVRETGGHMSMDLRLNRKVDFSSHLSVKATKKSLLRDKSYKERISAAENLSRLSGDSESSESSVATVSSHDTDKTLSTEITSATEALERIKKITSKKSPALKSQIEGASRSIEEAYHMVYVTKNQLLENAQRDINPTLDRWNLVSSTLSWAGRLTNTELRWLEKRQLSRKLSKPVQSSTGKSLIRMAYSLVLTFSNESLEKKKNAVGELNKFHRPLQKIQKQLYDLDALNQQSGQKESSALKRARMLYKKLLSLINEKMKQEIDKKDSIDALRSSVLAKTMRIHFDEWKRKMYKPEEQSQRLQAIRAGREEKEQKEQRELAALTSRNQVVKKSTSKSPNKHEKIGGFLKDRQFLSEHRFYGGDAHSLEEEAANMTIEDLDAMLDNLQGKIDDMMKPFTLSQPLGRAHSFYGGGFKMGDDSPEFGLSSPGPRSRDEDLPVSLSSAKAKRSDSTTFNF